MKIFNVILSLAVLTLSHVQAYKDGTDSNAVHSVLKGSASSDTDGAAARRLKKGSYAKPKTKPKSPKKCGGNYQGCCDDAPYCKPTLGCNFRASSYGSYGSYGSYTGRCETCGGYEQPCCQSICGEDECANICNNGFTCDTVMNMCVACGSKGKDCCDDDKCDTRLVCNVFGKCEACGADGEDCCTDDQCDAGNNCVNGKCEGCGGTAGAVCCDNGAPCVTEACINGRCANCGGVDQICCPGDQAQCKAGLICNQDVGQCTAPCSFKNGSSNAGCWVGAASQTEADANCCQGCCNQYTTVAQPRAGSESWFCTGNKPSSGCPNLRVS